MWKPWQAGKATTGAAPRREWRAFAIGPSKSCGSKCAALDCDPMHIAAVAVVVVDRVVPCGAIIPHCYIAVLPAHATLELGLLAMGVEAL